MHAQFNAAVAVLILSLIAISGCGSTKAYDLARTSPFSQYVGKDVTLTRDIVVFDGSTPELPQPCWEVFDPALPNQPWLKANGSHPFVKLPAGSRVFVKCTVGVEDRERYRQHWTVWSILVTKPDCPGCPEAIVAMFSHDDIPCNLWPPLGGVSPGVIRPAPWEPLDTAKTRTIALPGAGELIYQGKCLSTEFVNRMSGKSPAG